MDGFPNHVCNCACKYIVMSNHAFSFISKITGRNIPIHRRILQCFWSVIFICDFLVLHNMPQACRPSVARSWRLNTMVSQYLFSKSLVMRFHICSLETPTVFLQAPSDSSTLHFNLFQECSPYQRCRTKITSHMFMKPTRLHPH